MLRVDPRDMRAGAEAGDDAQTLRAALAETQAQLVEARRQFDQFVANLNGVAYRCQLEAPWRMSFVSEGVEALSGYPASAMEQAKAWADIMFPDDLAGVEAEVAAGVAERRSFNLCYRIIHLSGDLRWVREQGRAIYDENGRPLFLEGVISDAGPEKRLEMSLRQAEADASRRADGLHTLLDAVPQMIWSYDPALGPRFSRQWETFTGIDLNADGAPTRLDFIHAEDRPAAAALWKHSRETGEPYEAQYRIRNRSGQYRWILSRGEPHRHSDGSIAAWYGSCTDIHERVLAEAALDASEQLSRGILEASPDCISVLDLEGLRLFANGAAMRVYAVDDRAQLIGELWGSRFVEPARTRAAEALAEAQAGRVSRLLIQFGAAERWWDIILAPVRDEQGDPTRIIVLSRDISDQKKAEEKASWAANHDALTGLPNRFLLQKTLDEAIACAHVAGGGFGILLLDVDDFKRINDTLGHDAGDALLCTFAERIRGALRAEDMVARLGGDEFAVLLAGVEDEDGVSGAVDTILAALREPCVHQGRVLDCQASIGASLFPHQGTDRAELLKNADVALYAAKAAGRANLKLFQADMRKEMQTRLSMLNLARDALTRNLIVPYYQPKIDLRTGQVHGFEALLRWHHPSAGPQTPATIAAAFEDLSLAAEISDEMIAAVIADLRRWRDEGIDPHHVAINAAAAEFRRGDFADKLLESLHKADLPPCLLQVEVTETVFLGRGAECVERALKLLSAAGVGIALDDFGTGYASLSHLKQFPVDLIKIDRSFVRDLEEDPDDAAIIDAVVNLGRSLGIGTVAEGVENERQHGFVAALGCDYGQGYLYGKAAPWAEVAQMLQPREMELRKAG